MINMWIGGSLGLLYVYGGFAALSRWETGHWTWKPWRWFE